MTRNEQTAAEKRAPNFRRESKGDLTVAGDPMSIEGRVAFGGCSGSVFGMLAGAFVGFLIAFGSYHLPTWQPIELFTGLSLLVAYAFTIGFWIVGTVLGGVLGSMVGAAVGSALAAKRNHERWPEPK